LNGILGRNPKHYEARLLLAELCLSEEDFEEARKNLELAISERSQDAHSQHMMGLLLETMGEESEALDYYRRAAELEPDNEIYAASCRGSAEAFGEQPATEHGVATVQFVVPIDPKETVTPPVAMKGVDKQLSDARQA